ncbi:MAG: hypothetical protein KJ063_15205 [Anaerolineae bacterium]|nr:hypothetical protein [Anaerolineae bacterium]
MLLTKKIKLMLTFSIMLVLAVLVACIPGGGNAPDETATPTPNPDTAVRDDMPTTEPIFAGELITGTAMIHSVDLRLMESFPLQMMAGIKGDYPDGCTGLGEVKQERVENDIFITVETVRPADMMCIQVLVPFEANIPVDIHGLPAGKYQVHINGVIASFTLDQDNILPSEG